MTHTRRAFVRNNFRAPILNTLPDSSNYHEAKMYNFSHGGMYFESRRPHALGSRVRIIMVNYTPGAFDHEGYKYYMGRIRWLREASGSDARLYGAGVEFLERGHEAFEEEPMEARVSCDLCGILTPSGEIRRTEELPSLCPACFKHMAKITNKNIKASIERFVSGNVL